MNESLCTSPVPGGQLVYYLNDDGEAVLTDYIGNGRVLIIPPALHDEIIDIATDIPDEAFQSCTTVEYVVDMRGCNFGMFVFDHCRQLADVISLDTERTTLSEFSFTDAHNAPRPVQHTVLISEDEAEEAYAAGLFVQKLIHRFAAADDVERLSRLAALGNIGRTLRIAIEGGDLETLKLLASLDLLGETCPFAYSIARAIKYDHAEVFSFLLRHKMYAVYWTEGSVLFAAIDRNKSAYVKCLLELGFSPYARTPEWDGERPVLEYALENNRTAIVQLLRQYQQPT